MLCFVCSGHPAAKAPVLGIGRCDAPEMDMRFVRGVMEPPNTPENDTKPLMCLSRHSEETPSLRNNLKHIVQAICRNQIHS